MNSDNSSTFYLGSFIGSLIGGILLLVFDFAGWYNYNSYLGIEEYGSISISSGFLATIIIGICVVGMFFITFYSYKGIRIPLDRARLNQIYRVSIIVLIVILIGGGVFLVEASDATNYWLDTGFYGGSIGSLISVLTLRSARS